MRGYPTTLREDYDAGTLRSLAKQTPHPAVRQRMLGLAAVYDGASRAQAAEIAGIGRQILRDWIIRFNAEGPAGLQDSERKGESLSDEHRAILEDILDRGLSTRGGVHQVTYNEMLAELEARTGRTLSFGCLSQHIARVEQKQARRPIGNRQVEMQAFS